MSFDPAFEEFMTETVTLEPFVSESAARVVSYGAAVTVRCRIEQFAKLVRAQDGRDVVSNTRLYLKPVTEAGAAYTPTVRSKVTLPAGYAPQAPPVISVERSNDETAGGPHHWVVAL